MKKRSSKPKQTGGFPESTLSPTPPVKRPPLRRRGVHMGPYAPGKNWNCYQSAEQCPLEAFEACITTGRCESLTTYGTAPEYDLQMAFLKIYSEFCDLSKESMAIARFMSMAQIVALESKITCVQSLIEAIFRSPEKILVEALAQWGYKVAFVPEKPKQVFLELTKIESKLKTDQVRLQALKKEFEGEDGAEKKLPTTADFDLVLINLSAFNGYPLLKKDLTVQQYALHLFRAKAAKPNK